MRVKDYNGLTGKALFNYLKENKESIIATKRSMPITADPFAINVDQETYKSDFIVKNDVEKNDDPSTLVVKVVANTSMFCDSHADVLAEDCWKKTIKENGVRGKNIISHIHDHKHEIGAKIGKVLDIRTEVLNLKKMGVKTDIQEAQALIFETELRKDFNPKLFNLYKAGEVNQHSIGMQYVKMDLAVNDESDDFKQEYKVWKKHIDKIINRNDVEKNGFFWYVSEIKLFENSAVLFGANSLTPTLGKAIDEPEQSTQDINKDEPEQSTQEKSKLSYQNFI
jgi:uncharacterized protein Veg